MKLHSLSQVGFRTDDPQFALDVLSAIGLEVPKPPTSGIRPEVRIASLNAARFGFSEQQIDMALAETDLNITDRYTVKMVLFDKGLMRKQAA